jgi:hypothetical protein
MPRWALFELVVSSSLQMVGLISRTYFHLSGNTSKGQVIGFSSNVGWGKRPSSWWSQALPTMIAKNLSFFCLFFSACSASILRLISTGFRTSPFSYVLWLWSFAFFFSPETDILPESEDWRKVLAPVLSTEPKYISVLLFSALSFPSDFRFLL